MSDGLILLASVFALTLIYSGTRIIVAFINRRPADAARMAALEARLQAVAQQIEHLQVNSELTEQAIDRLTEAQQFTDALLGGAGADASVHGRARSGSASRPAIQHHKHRERESTPGPPPRPD
jgi:hypothetical protein